MTPHLHVLQQQLASAVVSKGVRQHWVAVSMDKCLRSDLVPCFVAEYWSTFRSASWLNIGARSGQFDNTLDACHAGIDQVRTLSR